MKWYYNLSEAIVESLFLIFNRQKQANKTILNLIKKNKKWGSRDRRFVSKVLFDIVRWRRLYEYASQSDIKTETGKWQVIATWAIHQKMELPDWEFFDKIDVNFIQNRLKSVDIPQIKESYPDWLHKLALNELGTSIWEQEMQALNNESQLVIRVNTLKSNKREVQQVLKQNNIDFETNPDFHDALFIKNHKKIIHLPAYKSGWFEIQDASSQMVAPFTEVKPGMTVIDACTGAGGKTLHLAALMQNQGKIYAYDIYQSKIDELKRRARRNGVRILEEATVITPEIVAKNNQKADVLLVDAPCSSLGTLRRNPGLKWELTPDKLIKINVIQKNILSQYAAMTKIGGYLIYVTCSILPSENKENVNYFLERHKNYTFVDEKTIYPSQTGNDGFYMAKLLRKY